CTCSPRRDTMHPRNKLFPLVAALFVVSFAAFAQTPAPPATQPQAQQAPAQQPQAQQPQAPTADQPQMPPGRSQDTIQVPQGQQPQEPKQEGNVFVFTTKVEEVQLHATV